MAGHDELVEVGGFGGVERLQREVVDQQQLDLGEPAHLGLDAVVEAGSLEPLEHCISAQHEHADPAAHGDVAERGGQVGFAHAHSEGDRLQQLRAVLPCDVRVVAETHPLFGRLLAARSFKRWSGVLMLVVELPDGSPGSIRADATDVFGGSVAEGAVAVLVLDAAGLRELHRLTQRLFQSRVAGFVDEGEVGSPRP